MIPIGETRDGRADMTNFELGLFDTRIGSTYKRDEDTMPRWCTQSGFPICIIALFIFLLVFFPLFSDSLLGSKRQYEKDGVCLDTCSLEIVESMPSNLTYISELVASNATYNSWMKLLSNAQKSIDLAVFYWNLVDFDDKKPYSTSWQGRNIFNKLIEAGKRGVKIRIAQNLPSHHQPQLNSKYLHDKGLAEVRSLNFSRWFGGFGVLHSKFWIIDSKHVYVGSANMDWKSLTEVKELGVYVSECGCVADDLGKVFSVYWAMGESENTRLPKSWPLAFRTNFNYLHPLSVHFNRRQSHYYLSSSPRPFNPKGRQDDQDAIVDIIHNARTFVHIAVMDYMPASFYRGSKNFFWPKIDNALRSAAFAGIQIRLLMSKWKHTKSSIYPFLRSLQAINAGLPKHYLPDGTIVQGTIQLKLFEVNSTSSQARIPYARVNHNKYMVTDNTAYIGTSNWAADYFTCTAGVGFVVSSANSSHTSSVVDRLNEIFLRDWNSPYSQDVNVD